jgi:hypothetical protein
MLRETTMMTTEKTVSIQIELNEIDANEKGDAA